MLKHLTLYRSNLAVVQNAQTEIEFLQTADSATNSYTT